jgi:hypothetical protein
MLGLGLAAAGDPTLADAVSLAWFTTPTGSHSAAVLCIVASHRLGTKPPPADRRTTIQL